MASCAVENGASIVKKVHKYRRVQQAQKVTEYITIFVVIHKLFCLRFPTKVYV